MIVADRPILGWTLALGTLVASVAVRLWSRGDCIPGWDILSAAQGLYLVSTLSPTALAHWYVANVWNPTMFWNLYAIPAVLLPGALAAIWPSLFWNHAVTFVLSLAVLWLTAMAFSLSLRNAWIVVLAWTTSSTLVSQSVAGLAYITCTLPHALAVFTVLRLRTRPVWTVIFGGLVYLAATQAQELGRTACLVFLTAAVALPAAVPTRLAWLLVGGLQVLDTIRHPTPNGKFFSTLAPPTPAQVWTILCGLADRLFLHPWIDLPTLVGVGLVSLVCIRRERWLWRLLFAAQVALVVVLALKRDVTGVWPRRFLLVDLYALFAVVALWTQWRATAARRWPARALFVVLIVGAGWQLADAIQFARQPLAPAGRGFTLPFVHTTVDYQTTYAEADWTRRMLAEARAGKALILAYNFSSYAENPTNPSGIPERLYLGLGHARWRDGVYFFGRGWRWNNLRARPVAEIDAFVDHIQDPSRFVGWYATHPNDEGTGSVRPAPELAPEMAQLFAALERRFTLAWESPIFTKPARIARFTLKPRPTGG